MWYSVAVPALEFDYLYTYTLSPSHFILALQQSCVLSTVVLINEYEYEYAYAHSYYKPESRLATWRACIIS